MSIAKVMKSERRSGGGCVEARRLVSGRCGFNHFSMGRAFFLGFPRGGKKLLIVL